MNYGTGRYLVRAQNRRGTYRYTNKASAKEMARALAVESMKASVYDDVSGAHWPIATYVRESSGRIGAIAV